MGISPPILICVVFGQKKQTLNAHYTTYEHFLIFEHETEESLVKFINPLVPSKRVTKENVLRELTTHTRG